MVTRKSPLNKTEEKLLEEVRHHEATTVWSSTPRRWRAANQLLMRGLLRSKTRLAVDRGVPVSCIELSLPFRPTHVFTLLDGTKVPVAAELRGDWVAVEEDGTRWATVMGVDAEWWTCGQRKVSKVLSVESFGASEAVIEYHREPHAAHYGNSNPAKGHDLSVWDVRAESIHDARTALLAMLRMSQDTGLVPEYHSGFRKDGHQWWSFVRTAPLSPGECARCKRS